MAWRLDLSRVFVPGNVAPESVGTCSKSGVVETFFSETTYMVWFSAAVGRARARRSFAVRVCLLEIYGSSVQRQCRIGWCLLNKEDRKSVPSNKSI